jgi:hypothetical protein
VRRRPVAGPFTQLRVLTRRSAETFVRNPLTLAILLASPVLVVSMFAVLFRAGTFDVDHPSPSAMVMIGFWIVFAAFFFGLTYALLQIVTERSVVHRERLVGLRLGAYVASKVTVLIPFCSSDVAMLGVAVARPLPDRPLSTYASMTASLLLCAVAALGLGLLASASVKNVAQATLALPMLCFPAVLFSGAILPVHLMARVGVILSTIIPSRWAFEAIGHDLGARHIFARGGSPPGRRCSSRARPGTASAATCFRARRIRGHLPHCDDSRAGPLHPQHDTLKRQVAQSTVIGRRSPGNGSSLASASTVSRSFGDS